MRRIPGPGGRPPAGLIRSYRLAGRPTLSKVVPRRAFRRAGLGALVVVVAVLAAQPAVLASSSPALDWTQQAPATHPPARAAAMAYDAATGKVVWFGGGDPAGSRAFGDTWTLGASG